jgi:hypothetical protein
MSGLAGDYNKNGVVDAADYTVWRDTLGSTIDLRADGNGNGVIDQSDYDVWKSNFGHITQQGVGSAKNAPATVPEPQCVCLLLLAVVSTLIHRRWR